MAHFSVDLGRIMLVKPSTLHDVLGRRSSSMLSETHLLSHWDANSSAQSKQADQDHGQWTLTPCKVLLQAWPHGPHPMTRYSRGMQSARWRDWSRRTPLPQQTLPRQMGCVPSWWRSALRTVRHSAMQRRPLVRDSA